MATGGGGGAGGGRRRRGRAGVSSCNGSIIAHPLSRPVAWRVGGMALSRGERDSPGDDARRRRRRLPRRRPSSSSSSSVIVVVNTSPSHAARTPPHAATPTRRVVKPPPCTPHPHITDTKPYTNHLDAPPTDRNHHYTYVSITRTYHNCKTRASKHNHPPSEKKHTPNYYTTPHQAKHRTQQNTTNLPPKKNQHNHQPSQPNKTKTRAHTHTHTYTTTTQHRTLLPSLLR